MLKVAHFVQVAPNRSGLYETTREITKGMNEFLSWDARMIDVTGIVTGGGKAIEEGEERGVPIASLEWAKRADVHFLHTGIPTAVEGTRPTFYFAHGLPEYIFYSQMLSEVDCDPNVREQRAQRGPFGGPWSLISTLGKAEWMKGAITLWKRHAPFLEPYFNRVIQSNHFCDLEKFTPEGDTVEYLTPADEGGLNITFADHWRYNAFKDPFQLLHGARKFCKDTGSRIHLYAIPKETGNGKDWHPVVQYNGHPWHSILYGVSEDLQYVIGDMHTVHEDIASVHRTADLLVTPSCDDTRTVLEAAACGCPVLSRKGTEAASFHVSMEDPYAVDEQLRRIHQMFTAGNRREESRARARELAERLTLKDAVKSIESGMLEVL